MNAKKRLLLFRNENELSFLKNWVQAKEDTDLEKKEAVLEKLSSYETLENCNICQNASKKIYAIGSGANGIFIIQNEPQSISTLESNRLKSDSIDLLKKMMNAIEIDYDNCYVTNLIKCERRDNIARPGLMFKNCERILRKEIKEIDPLIVIVLGDNLTLKRLINENARIFWYYIEHPITLLKNEELKRPAWNVLKMIRFKIQELSR